MTSRTLSVALYSCALAVLSVLVAQLNGVLAPAVQVGYWPTVSAVLLALAVFLCPEIPGRRLDVLKCVSLASALLSPFLCWAARLSACGVVFVPAPQLLYIQVMSLLPVYLIAWQMSAYGRYFAGGRPVFSTLHGVLLAAPLFLLLVPASAVLAGTIYLCFWDDGGVGFPLPLIPQLLWTVFFRGNGSAVFSQLFGASVLAQALGALLALRHSRKNPPANPAPGEAEVASHPENLSSEEYDHDEKNTAD